MKIGHLEFQDPVIALAPMAGASSVTFRGICHELGASYGVTELTSARSIVYNGIGKSFRYLEIDREREGVCSIQLFGNDPQDFYEAAKKILEDPRLCDVDMIDINMGCPVQKVVRAGAGSALMRTPEIAGEIVRKTKEAASCYKRPVTVKMRTGFTEDEKNGPEFIKVIADAGADAVVVHGRTAKQMYGGRSSNPDIRIMREAIRDSGIPFIANGDIHDGPSAKEILLETGADGIMIGRAAVGDPWIFQRVRGYLLGKREEIIPSFRDKCDMLIRELEGTSRSLGEVTAVKEMRSIMPHYIKGMKGAAKMKVRLCAANTIMEVKAILNESGCYTEDGLE